MPPTDTARMLEIAEEVEGLLADYHASKPIAAGGDQEDCWGNLALWLHDNGHELAAACRALAAAADTGERSDG